MRWWIWIGILSVLVPSHASADDRLAEVRLVPDTDAGRYRYTFELIPTAGQVEVVADRRLLEISIRPEGRRRGRVRCRHPDRPRRVSDGRVRTIGGAQTPVWREWVDLRMYCAGRRARLC